MSPESSKPVDPPRTKESASVDSQRESLSSLLRRCGPPPQDLVEQLTAQFERLVQSNPRLAISLDFNRIGIDHEGKLTDLDPEAGRVPDDEITPSPEKLETLKQEFLRSLLRRRPVMAKPQVSQIEERQFDDPESTPSTSAQAREDSNSNPNQSLAVDLRREALTRAFTTALTDRFGESVQQEAPSPVLTKRTLKKPVPEPAKNLSRGAVFAIATVCVVIGFIAVSVNQPADNEVADSLNRFDDTSFRDDGFNDTSLRERESPRLARDEIQIPEPIVAPAMPKNRGAFSSNRSQRNIAEDPLETLNALGSSEKGDKARVDLGSVNSNIDPDSLLAIDMPSGVILAPSGGPANAGGQSKATGTIGGSLAESKAGSPSASSSETPPAAPTESLESVLNSQLGDSAAGREVAQSQREAIDRFLILPDAGSPTSVTLPDSIRAVESLEFPISIDIDLRSDPDGSDRRLIVDSRSDTVIASVSASGPELTFQWTPEASDNATAKQLVHGRLRSSSGESLYLRPSIVGDPPALSTRARRPVPSWDVGAGLLPNVTQLDLDLVIPDGMEIGWVQPFDGRSARRGRGIAVFTPDSGESVSLAVHFDVRCSRKITCRTLFAARLDPNQPWQPFTREGVENLSHGLAQQLQLANTRKVAADRSYDQMDSIQRRMTKNRRDEIDQTIKQLEATTTRLNLLRSLVDAFEKHVKLNLQLHVRWPDSQQILFHTETTPDAS